MAHRPRKRTNRLTFAERLDRLAPLETGVVPAEPGYHRERVCTSKVPFGAATARQIAADFRAADGRNATAYRCPFCQDWHVGHGLSVEGLQSLALTLRTDLAV